jgi:hypothetical protein
MSVLDRMKGKFLPRTEANKIFEKPALTVHDIRLIFGCSRAYVYVLAEHFEWAEISHSPRIWVPADIRGTYEETFGS